jgi:peroxiredoxin
MFVLLCIPFMAQSAQKLVAQRAPDFALQSITGENVRLSEYRGEVVIVTFWSTNCGRCRDQLPAVGDLYDRHRDRGLKVLSVSVDDDIGRTRDTVADLRLQIPVLFDEQKSVSRLYDLESLPQIVIVDPMGTVRHVHSGYRRGDEQLYQDELEELLAE